MVKVLSCGYDYEIGIRLKQGTKVYEYMHMYIK